MNLRRLTARTAAVGAATALGATALVGFTGTAANAATATNTYACTNTALGLSFDSTLTVSGELPVPQYWAGAEVPAGLLNLTVTTEIDPATAAMMAGVGVTHARADDFTIALGEGTVPVPVEGDFVSEGGTTTWQAAGSNVAFVTPEPGTVDAVMPQAFTFVAEMGENDVPLNCELAEGETAQAVATDFLLMQQASATTAKNIKVKKGKKAVLKASVTSTSMGGPVAPGGKVVAKKGKKTLATGKVNKKGIAKLNLGKKLKPGKHKITVTYAGVPSFASSSAKATVTVKK